MIVIAAYLGLLVAVLEHNNQKPKEQLVQESQHIEVIWETEDMAEVCVDGYVFLFTECGKAQVKDMANLPITCIMKGRKE